MKEKKARVGDASARDQRRGGRGRPLGGVASCAVRARYLKIDDDQRFGVRIVQRAIEEPMRWIARNAGQDGSVVVDKVRQGKGSFGYNAATEEYEDLMKAGIIDPTKVVRTALQNAASVAGLLLTTEAMVAEKPKEEKAAAGGMPHGGEDF
jgi:chaperonin GroEL